MGMGKVHSGAKWYYMFLRNAEMKRYIDIFTGRKKVAVNTADGDGENTTVSNITFHFTVFPYTTSDHKRRFEQCPYTKDEYEERRNAASLVTDAFSADTTDKLNALTTKETIRGDGYLFVFATKKDLETVLTNTLPRQYLVTDYTTGKPAEIPARQMQEFIYLYYSMPYNIELLEHSLEEYTKKKTKIRITAGIFKGKEGYIMRMNRNNRLVFAFGAMTIAINYLHAFPFEKVE